MGGSLLQSFGLLLSSSEVVGKCLSGPFEGCQTRDMEVGGFRCPLGNLCGLSLVFSGMRSANSGAVVGFLPTERIQGCVALEPLYGRPER